MSDGRDWLDETTSHDGWDSSWDCEASLWLDWLAESAECDCVELDDDAQGGSEVVEDVLLDVAPLDAEGCDSEESDEAEEFDEDDTIPEVDESDGCDDVHESLEC